MDNNIFIQIKELNTLRRRLVAKLIEIRENKIPKIIEKDVQVFALNKNSSKVSPHITCTVNSKSQLEVCLKLDVYRIYVRDKKLYNAYQDNEKVYFFLPPCPLKSANFLTTNNLVSNYFNYNNINALGNYTLNVTNIYTAYYLKKINLQNIPLSVELKEEELIHFLNLAKEKFFLEDFEILHYGRVCNMIIKGNILDIKKDCYEYNLVDFKGRKFPVYFDGVNTYIFNYEQRCLKSVKDCSYIRLDFYEEDENTIKNIVNKYQ